jgi:opacity protein-like surface antigen
MSTWTMFALVCPGVICVGLYAGGRCVRLFPAARTINEGDAKMMKRAIACLVFAAFLALPALAAAKVGVYVAPRFLVGIQDSGEIKGGSWAFKQFSETVYGGAVAVGYNFAVKFNVPVRVEVEYALRTNSEGSRDTSFAGYAYETKYTMNISTVFLNAWYDIHTGTALTPYVGLGVGTAYYYAGLSGKSRVESVSSEKYDSSLACNIGLGVSWAFTETVAADLGYRFIYAGEQETAMNVWTGTSASRVKASPYINEVYLGARITF